jgi:hypothetical protein
MRDKPNTPTPGCVHCLDISLICFCPFCRYRTIENGDEASDSLEKLANFTVGESPVSAALSHSTVLCL